MNWDEFNSKEEKPTDKPRGKKALGQQSPTLGQQQRDMGQIFVSKDLTDADVIKIVWQHKNEPGFDSLIQLLYKSKVSIEEIQGLDHQPTWRIGRYPLLMAIRFLLNKSKETGL